MSGATNLAITSYTTEQLQEALYHLVDILDRCICPFILLQDTAKTIIEFDRIGGDGIYVGVRVKDYSDSVKSMMRTLSSNIDIRLGIDGFTETDQGLFWTFKGIPINIKLIDRKYSCIETPDQIYYWGEDYRIPNPFSKYWKMRNLIK